MTTRIIVARHGNTFTKEQTPTRVGCRTDLDLVETQRGTNIGLYLKKINMIPDMVYAAPLKRTRKTAELAIEAMEKNIPFELDDSFVEIDYGPDENKTEEEVIARIGQDAIDKWNNSAIVPNGWIVSVDGIINAWKNFADKVEHNFKDKTVMAVSSNGIIRFAPYLTESFEDFCLEHEIKVGTGSICIFEKEEGDAHWKCTGWNIKPKDFL